VLEHGDPIDRAEDRGGIVAVDPRALLDAAA
jgi:hypothetical protein